MTQIILGALCCFNVVLLLVVNHHTKKIAVLEEGVSALYTVLRQSLESQRNLVAAIQRVTTIVHEDKFPEEGMGKAVN